jgi:hypothetical protein
MAKGEWLRIDEHSDVLASTDLLALLAPRLDRQPRDWKWAILAAQNGMQGSIVCAIQDSTRTNVLTRKSSAEVLKWLETPQGASPKEQLADFATLLRRFRKTCPGSLSADQYCRTLKLHRTFRNQFAHFVPSHWSVEVAMLPELLLSAIDLIEVAMRQHLVSMRTSGNFKRQLARNLSAARKALAPGTHP